MNELIKGLLFLVPLFLFLTCVAIKFKEEFLFIIIFSLVGISAGIGICYLLIGITK